MITIDVRGSSKVAVCDDTPRIASAQDAMDLLADLWANEGCYAIAVPTACFCPEFFDLSTRLAGEILQKYTNYGIRLAIVGQLAAKPSPSLRDFIYECNKGNQIFFADSQAEALDRLHS